VHDGTVSILDIAPTVLAMFGVDAPASMRGNVLPVVARAATARVPQPA